MSNQINRRQFERFALPPMYSRVTMRRLDGDTFERLDRFATPFAVHGGPKFDPKGRFVFIFEPEANGLGSARRRAVEVGAVSSEGLEILSGLSEGELVITAGVRRIQDGLQVRLLEAPGSREKDLP